MDITKDKELVSAYKKEAFELLKMMNGAVNILASRYTKKDVFRLFRYAHTLKEISDCMGIVEIEKRAGVLLETIRIIKNKRLDDRLIKGIGKMIAEINLWLGDYYGRDIKKN